MLTIFNRKELVSTFSAKRQAKARQLLDENKIDYSVKVINRRSASPMDAGSRARTGTLGEKLDAEYNYIIYVHKKDYEKAAYVIKNN